MGNFFIDENQAKRRPEPLSPREAFAYIQGGAAIVDIRPAYETNYRIFNASWVYSLPFDSYMENYHEIPKDKTLVIVDNVGLRSPEVALFLLDQGYPHTAYLIGGVVEWEKCGLPLTKDLEYELVGGCACRLTPKKFS